MKTGVLFNLFAGIASLAHADDVRSARDAGGAIHPFAKYRNLAADANATPATTAVPTPTRPVLECFQVAEPVLTPSGVTRRDTSQLPALGSADQVPIQVAASSGSASSSCSVVLMVHTFANSYGAPFVGNYTPPKCDFDHVVINFTTLVQGRQFDRTGVMYLGDNEVWRTSTAEPTSYGIRWEWLKDMTAFRSLWTQPQTLIFDLENIVDSTYTGLLNTTLTATFFKAPAGKVQPKGASKYPPADLIIPISQRLGAAGQPSQFVYPGQPATYTVADFPRNANRAVFTVDVKGQGNEEFWWSNVPQSAALAFDATYGEYPGYSPFREVQVLIDGRLAGVSWPFPVIYTGGIVPQLNRPIVGVQAFDISEHEIDVSPFLPLLCDGAVHTFEIKIVGLVDDGKPAATAALSTTTDDEWYVTGKIFVWLDDAGSVTTGTLGNFATSLPTISLSQRLTQNATGANETLEYNLSVSRNIALSSYVKTQKTKGTVKWTQSLSYSNVGGVSAYGNNNLNIFSISGSDAATGPSTSYATRYAYPLFSNSTVDITAQGNLTIWAQVDQGFEAEVRGDAVFPTGLEAFVAAGLVPAVASVQGAATRTWRNGTANYYRPGDNSYSTGAGQTTQVFSFGGITPGNGVAELYYRDVSAFNDTVTADYVEISGKKVAA
ncbi:peptide N-acetyl-beta-D-glucosaminyl asparaginase amidase A-domain-containing protein [Hypoxylon argillaceum]|nr:peptide N-acetyl-beta-D-glucosaminyl asparaginase amidase A-domain-containing protein [Hypoxylon argillaceum]